MGLDGGTIIRWIKELGFRVSRVRGVAMRVNVWMK
jgi:predicted RNA binding protein YcfA (HicA-like mRNA interferase family)